MKQVRRMRGMDFLTASENRESFFRRVAHHYPTLDPRYQKIERAYNDAKDAFRGKLRDDGKTRYFEHIRAVALILLEYLRIKDPDIIVTALLHDIVEDKDKWTIDRVRNEYGDQVAYLMQYVTKPPEYSDKVIRDMVYHQRFDGAPRKFFLIKLADRFHNISTLWSCTEEKRRRKIEETRRFYLPYAERELILLHELEEVLELAEKV